MRKILDRRYFVKEITLLVFLFGVVILGFCTDMNRDIPDKVQVHEFTVCQGRDPMGRSAINPGKKFYLEDTENGIFACGLLTSDEPVHLLFYWFHGESGYPIYQNYDNLKFGPGYFYSELLIRKPVSPGNYRVDVYYYRQRLASAEFELMDNLMR